MTVCGGDARRRAALQLAVMLLCAALLGVLTGVHGAVIEVSQAEDVIREGDGCSLREAIRSANREARTDDCTFGEVGLDVIEIPSSLALRFVLSEQDGVEEDLALTGDLDITEDLHIQGTFVAANGRPRIDAQSLFTIFEVHGVRLSVHDVVLENGAGYGDPSAGAILNRDGFVSLRNVELSGHYAHWDGGNVEWGVGGAIFSTTPLVLDTCEVRDNTARIDGGSCAGGVFSSTGFAASNTLFADNDGRDTEDPGESLCGGAVAIGLPRRCTGGRLAEVRSPGGECADPEAGTFSCIGCTFERNVGEQGGAVRAEGSVVLTGSSFEENRAVDEGGAVWAGRTITMDGLRLGQPNGRLYRNEAERGSGGVAFSLDGDVLLSEFREVAENRAVGQGGVAYGNECALSSVSGDVRHNEAIEGYGGVLCARIGASLRGVDGHVRHNVAYLGGGVMFAEVGRSELTTVLGSIYENTAWRGHGGVLHSSLGPALIGYVSGDVRENAAGQFGGVIYSEGPARMHDIEGTISRNTAENAGGVVTAIAGVTVRDTGAIAYNSAGDGGGGAFASVGSVELERTGAITGNRASGYGGVVVSELGGVTVNVVRGGITWNEAVGTGAGAGDEFGVGSVVIAPQGEVYVGEVRGELSDNAGRAVAGRRVWVYDVRGDVSRNTGGVIAAEVSGTLEAVGGSVTDNTSNGMGGVLSCFGYECEARIAHVTGDIVRNHAAERGGVVGSAGPVTAVDVGAIEENTSGSWDHMDVPYYGGGVVYSGHDVRMERTGRLARNSALGYGGVVLAYGDVTLESVGEVYANEAARMGGAVYSHGLKVVLAGVDGSVWYNTGPYGGGVVYAERAALRVASLNGSVSDNTALHGSGGAFLARSMVMFGVPGGLLHNHCAYEGGCARVAGVAVVRTVGDIVGNTAFEGAFVFSLSDSGFGGEEAVVTIEGTGSVEDNRAANAGGVVYALGNVKLVNVNGDIARNYAGGRGAQSGCAGGVVVSTSRVLISNVGSILYNEAEGQGGVVCSLEATIEFVHGDVASNTASESGGVASTTYRATLSNVDGQVSYNGAATSGGVLYSEQGSVRLADVVADISFNYACTFPSTCFGGVAHGNEVRISGVFGRIQSNKMVYAEDSYGGVASGFDVVSIEDVTGIQDNSAGSGGVAYGGDVLLRYIYEGISGNYASVSGGVVASGVVSNIVHVGDITRNEAGLYGGVVLSFGGVYVSYVVGSISHNKALDGDGGALASESNTEVEYISGPIEHNSANYSGGFAYSFSGSVRLSHVGGVHRNVAGHGGGVIYAVTGTLENVAGSVLYNVATLGGGVVASFNEGVVRDVQGSVSGNAAREGDGGVVSTTHGRAELINVGGSVCDNTAYGSGGVVSSANNSASVSYVASEVCRNLAGAGGVVYASGRAEVHHTGSVHGNVALPLPVPAGSLVPLGGVVYGFYAIVADVDGDVALNSAHSGGVAFGRYSAEVRNVTGSIYSNRATDTDSDGFSGGVLFARFRAELSNVSGNVEDNAAGLGAGVLLCPFGAGVVRGIGGSVTRNRALHVGVVYADSVELERIGGSVSYNEGEHVAGVAAGINHVYMNEIGGDLIHNRSDGAGVAFALNTVTIRGVVGEVSYNVSNGAFGGVASGTYCTLSGVGPIRSNRSLAGGVLYAGQAANIDNVNGSIEYNHGGNGGGVSFVSDGGGEAIVSAVAGDVAFNNSAYGPGGVLCVGSGTARIVNVSGNVANNRGYLGGGVLYGRVASIEDVGGSIRGNGSADGQGGVVQAVSASVARIGGSVELNGSNFGGVFASLIGDFESGRAYAFVLSHIGGDIRSNSASQRGGVVYMHSEGRTIISEVGGSIEANVAEEGGVVYGGESISVVAVSGGIRENTGTALYTSSDGGSVTVNDVGDIVGNSTSDCGGFCAATFVTLQNVGSISGNKANGLGGGAICSPVVGGYVSVQHVHGSISANFAAEAGGAIFSHESVTVRHVSGDIRANSAYSGGAVAALGAVVVESVGGSVELNHAAESGGAFLGDSVSLSNVGGDVSYNTAGLFGGVALGDAARLHDVAGQVSFNAARDGGVLYAVSRTGHISDVRGPICGNTAEYDGGVIYGGAGVIASDYSGSISENSADRGGVVFAIESALVDAGNGLVFGNTASTSGDIVYVSGAGGVQQVEGALVDTAQPTIEIVQQPSGGSEGAPLATQPILHVPGATQYHPLPISVDVLVPPNNFTVPVEPDSFSIEYGSDLRFSGLSLPVAGEELVLRFSISTVLCGDTEPSVLSFVLSDPIDVSPCLSPSPIQCAPDITVETEPRECFAFATMALPESSACSEVEYSSTIPISPGEALAGAQFPLGTTLVTFDVEGGGETESCITAVAVVDSEPPTITCPAPLVAAADSGKCGARLALEQPAVGDNCGTDSVTIKSDHPSTFFAVGTSVVTWTARDSAGLEAQCSQEVVVVDVEAPELLCPTDLTLPCESPLSFGTPEAVDNCAYVNVSQLAGPALSNPSESLPSGDTLFVFEALDAQGLRSTCRWTVTTQSHWYIDADGDGVGAAGSKAIIQCPKPGANYVQDKNYDCDDSNPLLGLILYQDNDGDTWGNANAVTCSAWSVGRSSRAVEALSIRPGDCDDTNPFVNPGTAEVCFNKVDDNCNGQVDEGCPEDQSSYSIPTIPSSTIPASLDSR
eukprot:TRINITY_DN700_c0_g1_i1.p1 TRINITY_DN700_c0_g1~~TRINITY_DN700_c0_g1_i1.p1  ORF type:complete len:2669 (-),score=637.68 TRINITY_DN700_c0_g1_i1:110-8116(-)